MEKVNGGCQIMQGKFWLVQSGLTGRFVCDVIRLLLWWDEKFRLPRNYLELHEKRCSADETGPIAKPDKAWSACHPLQNY